jgi:hypothetical protein
MPPRAKPVQALQPCNLETVRLACKFRPEFANLLIDEQLAMMRGCFELIGPELRACSVKRDRLAEYIEAE